MGGSEPPSARGKEERMGFALLGSLSMAKFDSLDLVKLPRRPAQES